MHRLGEADAVRPERATNGETHSCTPSELRASLEAAEGPICLLLLPGFADAKIIYSEFSGHCEWPAAPGSTADSDAAVPVLRICG